MGINQLKRKIAAVRKRQSKNVLITKRSRFTINNLFNTLSLPNDRSSAISAQSITFEGVFGLEK